MVRTDYIENPAIVERYSVQIDELTLELTYYKNLYSVLIMRLKELLLINESLKKSVFDLENNIEVFNSQGEYYDISVIQKMFANQKKSITYRSHKEVVKVVDGQLSTIRAEIEKIETEKLNKTFSKNEVIYKEQKMIVNNAANSKAVNNMNNFLNNASGANSGQNYIAFNNNNANSNLTKNYNYSNTHIISGSSNNNVQVVQGQGLAQSQAQIVAQGGNKYQTSYNQQQQVFVQGQSPNVQVVSNANQVTYTNYSNSNSTVVNNSSLNKSMSSNYVIKK